MKSTTANGLAAITLIALIGACSGGSPSIAPAPNAPMSNETKQQENPMNLGSFSVSLSVSDLGDSRQFYATLGFAEIDGSLEQKWLVMQNGEAKIGLFQGMFEGNMITFNPPDARSLQDSLKRESYELLKEAEEGDGPASFVVKDPDGNVILVDQI